MKTEKLTERKIDKSMITDGKFTPLSETDGISRLKIRSIWKNYQ